VEEVLVWVEGAGVWGPVVFALVYALGTVLVVPGLALTFAGGALFGPFLGTAVNVLGATLGASGAFLIARYLGAEWVEHRIGGRLRQVRDGIDREGWRFVAFVRLVPLFPFVLLNYALGLTRIPLGQYVVTSLICMLPAAAAYTWLGHAGREVFTGEESMIQNLLIALALLALVMFLPRFVASMRRGPSIDVQQLRDRLGAGDELLVLDVRTPEECVGELGHLPQAINIPLDVLAQRVERVAEWMEKPVAIVCRTDVRSAKAARILASQGFADVHVVSGGMTAWNKAGLPVSR
jgi:uncharacterized membrane protein YdjX (TVP38/TMEM64 family)/rhodanese-related sulfurtransferase